MSYLVCHGDSTLGTTHVPPAIQGNITQVATAQDATCVVTDQNNVACWGVLPSPPVTCPTVSSIQVYFEPLSSVTYGVLLCSNGSLTQWNGATVTATGVTAVTASPNNACYVNAGATASCFEFSVPGSYDGTVEAIYAGDGGAAIIQTGIQSISLLGSYSSMAIPWRAGHTVTSMRLAGPIVCTQWDDGWLCTSSQPGASQVVTQLWAILNEGYSAGPYDFGALGVYGDWNNSQTGIVCVQRPDTGQTWCQGTGFTPHVGDITDGIFTMNADDTKNTSAIAVSSTHACAVVGGNTSVWAWIIFGLILAFILIAFWVAVRAYRREYSVNSYRYIPV